MNTPCNFKQIESGWWECTECRYIHRKPSNRAPVRLCGSPAPKPTQVTKKPQHRPNRAPRPLKRHPRPPRPAMKPKPLELGDLVEKALTTVGITSDRVTRWLGRPCGCAKRREKLNELSRWAKRVIGGKTENAEEYLEEIISD